MVLLRNLGDKHVVFHALGEHIKSTENQFRPKADIAAACSFRNALSKRARSIFDRTKVVPYTPIFLFPTKLPIAPLWGSYSYYI